MNTYQLIRTLPNDSQFHLFNQLPLDLYPKGSPRFQFGNDPVNTHLEGCYVLLKSGIPVGRFAFYENPNLIYQGRVAACIGSYECIEDLQSSQILLQGAKDLANQKTYPCLIGPMEGSTTNNYRFSQHHQSSNFFLEPYHHLYYNEQFQNAGFQSIAHYFSNIDQSIPDKNKLDQLEQHYLKQGAVLRSLNPADFENDLRKIALLSKEAFANNFLYTPIQVDDFINKYAKLHQWFDPQLIWMVEDALGELQAFLFAIKDYADPKNENLIIKSMARKKTSSFRGIGTFLSAKAKQIAHSQGYKNIIHAFMFQDNPSLSISKNFQSTPYKTHVLYCLNSLE